MGILEDEAVPRSRRAASSSSVGAWSADVWDADAAATGALCPFVFSGRVECQMRGTRPQQHQRMSLVSLSL
ncbi:hypothetical protein U9M48_008044 [Paspalum notatum var. saurae]|uniref:Uncharacterized protein n=1 Tax=Paspalum notatum var. saurae TaxID=547442 RepID=A0AAQ3SNB4_PASNO